MLMERYNDKNEKYRENELIEIEYSNNYTYIPNSSLKFYINSEVIETDSIIDMELLTAINKKVQELGWIHEREEKENA